MINRLSYFISSSTNPYLNLAVEEYLLETVKPNQLILYLWQNERTVVIGKNQNAWKECRFQELEADGGHLARRLSGGGAVFHDLGNLNFTFLIPSSDYDLSKQMSVILEAVRSLGIDAQKSGRNDVTVDGKKFSGNAFCQKGGNSYHHGTLMLRVDTQKVARYLNVSEKKLRSKGVSSVTSRVCNLCDFIPDLTREQMQQELLKALSHVYGLEPEAMDDQNFDTKRVMSLYSRYSSWDWLYGRKIPFTRLREERFDWGEIQLQLNIDNGIIEDAALYSDSLDERFIERIAPCLKGCRFEPDAVLNRLLQLEELTQTQQQQLEQIASLTRQDSK